MFTLLQAATNGTGILPPITVEGLLGDFFVLLVLSACLVGIALRTLGKYWDKWRDGEVVSFDKVFLATGISAFIAAVVPALAIFPQASAMFVTSVGQYGMIISWIVVVGWAYGLNEAVNYTYRRTQGKIETELVKSGKLDNIIDEKVRNALEKSSNSSN